MAVLGGLSLSPQRLMWATPDLCNLAHPDLSNHVHFVTSNEIVPLLLASNSLKLTEVTLYH